MIAAAAEPGRTREPGKPKASARINWNGYKRGLDYVNMARLRTSGPHVYLETGPAVSVHVGESRRRDFAAQLPALTSAVSRDGKRTVASLVLRASSLILRREIQDRHDSRKTEH